MYGNIELDFTNTKIIRNGRVLDLEEAELLTASSAAGGATDNSIGTTVEELGKANEKVVARMGAEAEERPAAGVGPSVPMSSIQNSYAVDVGKFKAGMDKVDAEEVKRVIEETSCHSEYYKTQEKRLVAVEKKVNRYVCKLRNFKSNKELWARTTQIVQKCIEEYSNKRDVRRTWMHVDLDMFYAACEIRDNPKLAKKPLAVGDNAMIQTTNYIARKYGVKSAMPGFIGRKLCPHLVFVKPDYAKYRRVSDEFKAVLQ